MFCLAALRRTRFGSTQVLTLRLPLPSVYPRVLTHSLLWHIGAVQICRAAIRRIPATGSVPLRGRQAEFFKYQTPRSEPRRKLLFTGHRSSSFAERVRRSPVKWRGSSPWGLAPFWLLFVRTKSTRGVRGRVGPVCLASFGKAQRPPGTIEKKHPPPAQTAEKEGKALG